MIKFTCQIGIIFFDLFNNDITFSIKFLLSNCTITHPFIQNRYGIRYHIWNGINVVRRMIGSTKSYDAEPGTIRGDFGLDLTANIIHASDSEESFIRESSVLFSNTK